MISNDPVSTSDLISLLCLAGIAGVCFGVAAGMAIIVFMERRKATQAEERRTDGYRLEVLVPYWLLGRMSVFKRKYGCKDYTDVLNAGMELLQVHDQQEIYARNAKTGQFQTIKLRGVLGGSVDELSADNRKFEGRRNN